MVKKYSNEELEQLDQDRLEWTRRGEILLDRVLSRKYVDVQAEIYARQGLCRRLGYLDHALLRLHDLYPPNTLNASRYTVRDVELLLHSFVMNVFGAIDNLAWVWVLERGVKGKKGKPLSPSERVFLGEKSQFVLDSLTPKVKSIIQDAGPWFAEIGNYRHGIAHQIPLYIPRCFREEDLNELKNIDHLIEIAIAEGDSKTVLRLNYERAHLGGYGPYMALSGVHRKILLHAQTICDLATVVNLGEAMFESLEVDS